MTLELAKKICKEHGVNGFRKLKLKRPLHVAGKQGVFLNGYVATNLLDRLAVEGFVVSDAAVCRELAAKGYLDCITIEGLV